MTQLVGILNITPDSFSDGGKFYNPAIAINRAEELFAEGASIVDVGAESTRPNATVLSDDEEWARLKPVLEVLIPRYSGKISIDTHHPATVEKALDIGEVIINDVTGMNNPEMIAVVCRRQPIVIVSHLPNMSVQQAHELQPVTTTRRVRNDLLEKAQLLEKNGLSRSRIILDPGIGFGKTMELNTELLRFAEQVPDYNVMIGYSKKRFLGEKRMELEPNLEAGRVAITSGAKYLRVHDVAGHSRLIAVD